MKNTNNLGIKWYHFLVHFWLPLNIFVNLLLLVVTGRALFPAIKFSLSCDYELLAIEKVGMFFLAYIFAFMLILPLIYTIIVRSDLRRVSSRAPQTLSFWYVLPILINVGLVIFVLIFKGPAYTLPWVLITVFCVIRAVIMIPQNNRYLFKRLLILKVMYEEDKIKRAEAKKEPRKSRKAKKRMVANPQIIENCGQTLGEYNQIIEEGISVPEVYIHAPEESAPVSAEAANLRKIPKKLMRKIFLQSAK